MATHHNYIIVTYPLNEEKLYLSRETFQKEVEKYLADGYVLIGGVSLSGGRLVQAVALPSPKELEP